MAKTGRFIHSVTNPIDIAAVGTAYDAAKLTVIQLNTGTFQGPGTRFSGRIEGIFIKLKSISSAANITMRGVTSTDLGSLVILPDTTAAIQVDITTATLGTVAFKAGLDWDGTNDQLNIFYKTDAGTVTVDSVTVTFSE